MLSQSARGAVDLLRGRACSQPALTVRAWYARRFPVENPQNRQSRMRGSPPFSSECPHSSGRNNGCQGRKKLFSAAGGAGRGCGGRKLRGAGRHGNQRYPCPVQGASAGPTIQILGKIRCTGTVAGPVCRPVRRWFSYLTQPALGGHHWRTLNVVHRRQTPFLHRAAKGQGGFSRAGWIDTIPFGMI